MGPRRKAWGFFVERGTAVADPKPDSQVADPDLSDDGDKGAIPNSGDQASPADVEGQLAAKDAEGKPAETEAKPVVSEPQRLADLQAQHDAFKTKGEGEALTSGEAEELRRLIQSRDDQETGRRDARERKRQATEKLAELESGLGARLKTRMLTEFDIDPDETDPRQRLADAGIKAELDAVWTDIEPLVLLPYEAGIRQHLLNTRGVKAEDLPDGGFIDLLNALKDTEYARGRAEHPDAAALTTLREENAKLRSQIESGVGSRDKGGSPASTGKEVSSSRLTKESVVNMTKDQAAQAWRDQPEEMRAL